MPSRKPLITFTPPPHLLLFGPGYVGLRLALSFPPSFTVSAISRKPLNLPNCPPNLSLSYVESPTHARFLSERSSEITHVLSTVAPTSNGDAVIPVLKSNSISPNWMGYLSTTGVYGDHAGKLVNEISECRPERDSAKAHLNSEKEWMEFSQSINATMDIFRLAGVYGLGRDRFKRLSKERPLTKRHLNLIHVDDIVRVIKKAMNLQKGGIWNLSDDGGENTELDKYLKSIMDELGVDWRNAEKVDENGNNARHRSTAEKRVDNRKLKTELLQDEDLLYPTFREGYLQIAKEKWPEKWSEMGSLIETKLSSSSSLQL